MTHLPSFKSLPEVKGMPHGCAWGLFDQPGQDRDQVGTLNLLTPQVVLEAKKEIHEGESVALNWGMRHLKHPGFGRKPLVHKVFDLPPFIAYDDEIEVNTQAGSQWDGLSRCSTLPIKLSSICALSSRASMTRALGPSEEPILLQRPAP